MSKELPKTVEKHVTAVLNEVISEAVGVELPLKEMGEGVYVNEYGTPRMEDADMADVFAVIEHSTLGLDAINEYVGVEKYEDDPETALRYAAALNLNHLVMDRIDALT